MDTSISRRTFLRRAGITAGAIALTGVAGMSAAKYAVTEPETVLPRQIVAKENGMSKTLIAYASKCGSTGEIAVAIAEELQKSNFSIEVLPVQEVVSLESYDHVILGTALRFEKPLNEMMDFITRFSKDFSSRKIACYSAGVYMRDPSPINRAKTEKMLESMMDALPEPVSVAMFGGMVDYKKIAPFWRFLVTLDSSGLMREGDGRDWGAIKGWARNLGTKFLG